MRRTIAIIAAGAVCVGGVELAGADNTNGREKAQESATKRGPRGRRGPQGPPGIPRVVTIDGPEAAYPPGSYGASPQAECPAGMVVVGTGFNGPFNTVGGFVLSYGTFVGGFFENDSSITVSGNVQAICAIGEESYRSSRDGHDRFREDVARAAAQAELTP